MLRSSLIAAGAALLCGVASAQNTIDPSKVFPITTPIKDAGVYDFKTGQFYPRAQAGALTAGISVIFNNTCTWSGGGFYVGSGACDEYFDEGLTPLVANGACGVAGPANEVDTFEFAYCTATMTGKVDIETNLWNSGSLGFACPNVFQFRPDANHIAPVFSVDWGAASGFPLPGGATTGSLACWIVTATLATPACLSTGTNSSDLFFYTYLMKNTDTQNGAVAAGPILSGDLSVAGASGAGTYCIPPVTDPIYTASTCGHGLLSEDAFWINADGVGTTGTPPPAAACGVNNIPQVGCYWFGSWPGNPFAGTWYRLESNGACTTCTGNVADFCLPGKVNSLGCVPSYTTVGTPSESGSTFTHTVSNLLQNKNGLYFYSVSGTQRVPFQGYFLCPKPPLKRMDVQNSGNSQTFSPNCLNSVSTNFNTIIQDPAEVGLVLGASVATQYWSRDPGSPSTTNLSSAKRFVICP